LTIQNIESFYNYATIDNDYKLVTSVLSTENSFITLKIKSQKDLHQNFQVLAEEEYFDEPVSLHHLHNKKNRIRSALTKIKQLKSLTQESVSPFYDYFSLTEQVQQFAVQENDKSLPVFCRPPPGPRSKSKKSSCDKCTQLCSYTIEMILHPTKSISHDDILEELEIHGHPTSRKYNDENGIKRNRSKLEAGRELADHLIYSHNQKEPYFLQ
jgi:hypothetical protein